MILVRSSHQNVSRDVKRVMGILDTRIWFGMRNGAREIAQSVVKDAQDILSSKIAATGGVDGGVLSGAIFAKNADPGFKNFARWDVEIDTKRAPHADWVESGVSADSLPWSRDGSRDYSKTSFQGHRYMQEAFEVHEAGKANQILGEEIIKALVVGNKR